MTPELRARGGHRLGEPFERQPRSLLSTREQQARGLVRCIDFPMGDRQASGFLRARHGSVSGRREATPTNIVRGHRKEELSAPRSLWRRSETPIGTGHAKLERVSKIDPASSAFFRESGYERGDRLEIADPCEVDREVGS